MGNNASQALGLRTKANSAPPQDRAQAAQSWTWEQRGQGRRRGIPGESLQGATSCPSTSAQSSTRCGPQATGPGSRWLRGLARELRIHAYPSQGQGDSREAMRQVLLSLALWLGAMGLGRAELTVAQHRGLQVALEEFHKHPPVQWAFRETSVDSAMDTVSGTPGRGGG